MLIPNSFAIDGKNLLLFNSGDIYGLAKQMEKMILNEKLREAISVESTMLAHTTFNIKTINKQLGDIYEELIRK